jgi:hypothetical protein
MSAILGDRFADTSSVKSWDGHGTFMDDRSRYDTLGYSTRWLPAAERRYIRTKEQIELYFLLAVVLAVSTSDLVWRLRPRRHRVFDMLHSWHRLPRLRVAVHNSTVSRLRGGAAVRMCGVRRRGPVVAPYSVRGKRSLELL